MTDEKAELEALVTSPGWLRVLEHARQEWKEDYPAKVKLAMQGADPGIAWNRVDAASDAVNALLTWPKERLRVMAERQAREAEPFSVSRRGAGL